MSIVGAVTSDTRAGGAGSMTLADLDGCKVIERTPVCGPYRGDVVCSMGPPSSGGIAELQILGILGHLDLAALGPNDVQTVHAFLQANRLAFADRNLYVADPAYVPVPTAGLIDPGYLDTRAVAAMTKLRRRLLLGSGMVRPGPVRGAEGLWCAGGSESRARRAIAVKM